MIEKHGTITINSNGAITWDGFVFDGVDVFTAMDEALRWAEACIAQSRLEMSNFTDSSAPARS